MLVHCSLLPLYLSLPVATPELFGTATFFGDATFLKFGCSYMKGVVLQVGVNK